MPSPRIDLVTETLPRTRRLRASGPGPVSFIGILVDGEKPEVTISGPIRGMEAIDALRKFLDEVEDEYRLDPDDFD